MNKDIMIYLEKSAKIVNNDINEINNDKERERKIKGITESILNKCIKKETFTDLELSYIATNIFDFQSEMLHLLKSKKNSKKNITSNMNWGDIFDKDW